MRALPPEIREQIDKLERKHAENPDGRYFVPLANALRKAGDTTRAMSILREGIERHPDYVSAHIVLARCLQDEGATDEAEASFKHVLALDPQNLVALRAMGELAAGAGRAAEAAKWYDLLLEVDPMNEEARSALDSLSLSEARPVVAEHGETSAESPPEPEEPPRPEWGSPDATGDSGSRPHAAGDDASASAGPEVFGDGWGDAPQPMLPADSGLGPAPAVGGPFGSDEGGALTHDAMNDPRAFRIDDGPDDSFDDEGAVVTETIAELYVRQGFHDRAVSVYRELIRRRGPDENLERRLARVERLAAGMPEVDSHDDDGVSPTAPGTADEGDAFADSFADGFPTLQPEDSASFDGNPEGVTLDAVAGSSEAPADAPRPAATIRDYLRSVLTWAPAVADTTSAPPGAAAQASAGEPLRDDGIISASWDEPSVQRERISEAAGNEEGPPNEPDFVEGYAWADRTDVPLLADLTHGHDHIPRNDEPDEDVRIAWSEPEISPSSAQAEPARAETPSPPPRGTEDDLFPWELPADPAPRGEPERIDGVAADYEAEVQGSSESESTSDSRAEEHRTWDTFRMEPSEAAEESAPSSETLRDSDEDDDDLESFQAWLRSLKR